MPLQTSQAILFHSYDIKDPRDNGFSFTANSPSLSAYTGLPSSRHHIVSLTAIKSISQQHVSCHHSWQGRCWAQRRRQPLPSQQAWAAPGTSPSTCWLQSQGIGNLECGSGKQILPAAQQSVKGMQWRGACCRHSGFPWGATPCSPGDRQESGAPEVPRGPPLLSASIRPPLPRRGPQEWLHTDSSALEAPEWDLTPLALQMLPFSKCADGKMGGKLYIRLN